MEKTLQCLTLVSLDADGFETIIFVWNRSKLVGEKEFKEYVYGKIDALLVAFGKKSLLGDLNDMQSEVLYATPEVKGSCFENKYTIPVYFINLILQKYNLKLIEERS